MSQCKKHDGNSLPRLGIQLYSVRDMIEPELFDGTLSRLAALGFEGIEFAWQYGGMHPEQLAACLRSHGLVCCGLHVRLEELLQPDHEVYRIGAAVGSPYITTSLGGQEHEWDRLLPLVNQAARIAADRGLRFTYHNHWQEFDAAPGASAYDRLVAGTEAALTGLEMDLGWMHKAGRDAMELWRSLHERVPQIHLRDYNRATEQVCDLGDGFIEPDAVWRQGRELGLKWLIYEQDRYPVSPMESARVCVERMLAARMNAA